MTAPHKASFKSLRHYQHSRRFGTQRRRRRRHRVEKFGFSNFVLFVVIVVLVSVDLVEDIEAAFVTNVEDEMEVLLKTKKH